MSRRQSPVVVPVLFLALLSVRCTTSQPDGLGSEPAPPPEFEIAIGPAPPPPVSPGPPAQGAPEPEVSRREEPTPDAPAVQPRSVSETRQPRLVDMPDTIERQDRAIEEGRGETLLAGAIEEVDRHPGDPDRLYLLGRLQGLLHQVGAARASFERAIAIDPEHAWSLHGRGVLEHRDGRTVSARESFEKALSYDPENVRFAMALASLEYESAGAEPDARQRIGRLERAAAALESLGTIPPEGEIVLALVLFELGRTAEAVDHAARAARGAPRSASILASRGRILEAAERLDDALAAYRDVLSAADDGPEADFARARVERLEQVLRASGSDRIAAASRPTDLAAYLIDADPQIRRNAFKRLRELRQPGDVPTFLRGLADADRGVRIHSIWALGELGAAEALPALLDILHHDRDELARGAVGKALVDLSARQAIGDLVEALAAETHPYVLDQVDFALRNLSGDDPLTGSAASRRTLFDTPEGRARLVSAWREWWNRRATSGRGR